MRRNLSDHVAEHLRQLIFGGLLAPGAHVPQDEVADELGVSRIPIREALIALEAEGLVGLEPHRGAFVQPIGRQDVEDHYQMYGLIHGIAAARSAASIDEEGLAELQALNDEMRVVAPERLSELNWQFHRIINHLGGSRRLRAVLRTLARNIPANFFEDVRGSGEIAVQGHQLIIDALRRGDGDDAARACHAHLQEEGLLVVQMMRERDVLSEDVPSADER